MTGSDQPIALVTGASRGIGAATALELAAQGWRVVATARAQSALERLDDAIQERTGARATLVPLDLTDFDGIDRLGAALFERFGRIDGLVSCAGDLGLLTPSFEAQPRMVERVIAVNLTANQRLIRSMHPLLRAAPAGRAVFLTSGATQSLRAYWGPYAASKAGLEALVKVYAAEIAAVTAIKVNLLDPGPTRTRMRAAAFPGEDPMSLKPPETVAKRIVELLAPDLSAHGERFVMSRVE